MRPADFHLDVDSFAGPFDLLCTILLRRELTLDEVSLAEVAVGYLQQLQVREEVDPDTASEFVVLLAALLEIKARELLASSEEHFDIEEPASAEAQEDLLERLMTYSSFKQAAAWLGERGSTPSYWRVASRPVIRRNAGYEGPVMDPALLRRSLQVLLAQPNVDVRHLVGKHVSVHEMTQRLLHLVRSRACSFDDAVDGCSRLDQAVAFVAMLELCKNGHVSLRQPEPFGPIGLERAEDVQAAPAASAATAPPQPTEVQIA